MKLGLQLGYWGAQPPANARGTGRRGRGSRLRRHVHRRGLGLRCLHAAGLVGLVRRTRMRLGTSVVQLSARTPTACAMAALTLDHLSGGRHILGLGVSGPQVVEGWYGQKFPKPLARTREYIDIVRQVLAREAPVVSDGPHYPLPLTGEGTTGLGKSLKPITHPLRADIPILLGAEGPKNVALAAEICDGWLPIFYTPRHGRHVQRVARRGFRPARAHAGRARLRDLRDRPHRDHRRPARHIRADEAVPRALHGRHGLRGHQLPRRGVPADGVRRASSTRSRGCSAATARTTRPRSSPTSWSTTPRSSATSTTCVSRSPSGKPPA